MKRCFNVIAVCLTAVMPLDVFQDKSIEAADVPGPTLAMQSRIQLAQLPATPAASSQRKGKVVDVINTGGYTYVQIDSGDEKVWAAAPMFQVNVNDIVVMPQGIAMNNFHSKTLNRTFDVVYFVAGITVAGAEQTGGKPLAGHPKIGSHAADTPTPGGISLSGIARAEGGKTVAELYAEKAVLSGKQVSVRGKVVKFNTGIMGKNWMHLKDGTGAEGYNDLTVTTSARAKLGDTVLVQGVVVTDKDYGYGYTYPLLIENARVTVE